MSQESVTIFKYHGIGNDFVVIDAESLRFDPSTLAASLCDRHRGVGADGVIVVKRGIAGHDAQMTIYNRDGSRPQMCGNGIRCVARHLVERHGVGADLRIVTDAGVRRCVVSARSSSFEVDVEMGNATVGDPLRHESWTFVPVDMGNPHAVVFEQPSLAEIDRVGAVLNGSESPFAAGVNVEFTRIAGGDELHVVVYERGVGRTQACGTGACASAAAAWHAGHVTADSVVVHLPGGALTIRRDRDSARLWMRGEAECVMEAELAASWLQRRMTMIDTEVEDVRQ